MSRRIGRWIYNGSGPLPGWHLEDSPVVLDFDPSSHACCIGGPGCRGGAYILYGWPGRDHEPVSSDLRSAMEWAEEAWDRGQRAQLAIDGITCDELTAALTELATRTGNENAYYPALATHIFRHIEKQRALEALAGNTK